MGTYRAVFEKNNRAINLCFLLNAMGSGLLMPLALLYLVGTHISAKEILYLGTVKFWSYSLAYFIVIPLAIRFDSKKVIIFSLIFKLISLSLLSLGNTLSSAGGTFGIFSGNILSLTLTAVETDKQSKLLSVPRILTMSGKRGFISSGQNVPIVTGKIIGQGVDAKNPFQTIERRDVGISLDVTPVVLSNNTIMLSVKSKADSISSISSASDIPLIGWLFDSESDSQDNSTMYILIRARIVRLM